MNKRIMILAVLAVAVWATVSFWPEEKQEQAGTDTNWPAMDVHQAQSVTVASPKGDFTLTNDKGSWLISTGQGPALRAAVTKVDSLLDYVADHGPTRRLQLEGNAAPDSKTLAPYGLDKPQTVLTLQGKAQQGETAKAAPWRIAIGDKNPAGDGVYALSSNVAGILLLDAQYAEKLSQPASQYHDLRLLDIDTKALEKIRLISPSQADQAGGKETGFPSWELERAQNAEAAGESAQWRFTWPQDLATKTVDMQEANMYAHDLATLEGTKYLTDFSPQGLTPGLEFSFWRSGAEKPEQLRIYQLPQPGEAKTLAFAAVSSWQKAPVAVDAKMVKALAKTGFYLSQRGIIELDRAKVERMELEPAAKDRYSPLVAVSEGTTWQTESGTPLPGFDVLLWRLGDLKYLDTGRAALPPTAKLALTWRLYDAALQADDAAQPAGDAGQKPDGSSVVVSFHEDDSLPPGQCWAVVEQPYKAYPVERELLDDLLARLSQLSSAQ